MGAIVKTKSERYACPVAGMGYIYALIHPVTKEVRYIGQTGKVLKYRLATHINCAMKPGSGSSKTPVGKWIKKLRQEGFKPEIIQIDFIPKERLNEYEINYIKEGHIKYRLLNIAKGGVIEGRKKGSKQTEEFCRRQSEVRRGVNNHNFINYVGHKFNQLTVIEFIGFIDGKEGSNWLCKCECGNTKIVNIKKMGRTKSCGCSRKTRWTAEERMRLSDFTKYKRKFASNGHLLPLKSTP